MTQKSQLEIETLRQGAYLVESMNKVQSWLQGMASLQMMRSKDFYWHYLLHQQVRFFGMVRYMSQASAYLQEGKSSFEVWADPCSYI